MRSYSRYCKSTLLFIVGNALISELKTVGDALDIRARCTEIISRLADGSVEEERRERETGATGERETKDNRHLRTYKHARHTHTHTHTYAEKGRERWRERSNGQQQQQQQQTRPSVA